jgi:hypothetical protein
LDRSKRRGDQLGACAGAGFFFAVLGFFAAFGGSTGSGPRSTEFRRPPSKV